MTKQLTARDRLDDGLSTDRHVKVKDIAGLKSGRLEAVQYAYTHNRKAHWHCVCICGNQVIAYSTNLTRGAVKSCGCLLNDTLSSRNKTHGMTGTKEYGTYTGAKSRCENRLNPKYASYGGRGVEFRFSSFEEFYKEVGEAPSSKHSIDRIDNNGNYEPGNLTWSTPKEQANNRRSNVVVWHLGDRLTITQLADRLKRDYDSVYRDYKKGILPIESVAGVS